MADGGDQVIAGFLLKQGEPGTGFLGLGGSSWRQRYIVVDRGALTFYRSESDYEQRRAPVKNRLVSLRLYAVVRGPDSDPRSFALVPIPPDSAAGRERKERGEGDWVRNADGTPRTFALRSVEVGDRDDWITVFQEEGCMPEDEYRALVGTAKKDAAPPAPESVGDAGPEK